MRHSISRLLSVHALALGAVLLAATAHGQSISFRRGDTNADGNLDLSDAVKTLLHLFSGGEAPGCMDAADANDDGGVNITDPLFSLTHLFLGGGAPPAPGLQCGADPTADSLECAAYAPCGTGGQSEFSTPIAGGFGMGPGRAEDDMAGGGPAPPNAAPGPVDPADPAPAAPERLIEESDIYKLAGDDVFILNRYRGLQIVSLADPDRPVMIGRAPIFGYPREMYVRGNTAYVIVSDYFTFWRDEAASDVVDGFYGSQLRILDVSDRRNPVVVGGINLAGDCSDSRIVGDVMYLVSHRYPWWGWPGSTDTEDKTQVLSVQIGDPADVRVIDTEDFPRNGWEHHIHATASAIYLASSGWVSPDGYQSRVRYIDISDPAGDIRVRDEAAVPGRIQDRWSMDEHGQVLRVASGQGWGNGDVYLTTFSVADPDNVSRLGGYTLHVDESLTAARFSGDRGYLVTYRNIDPLFVFDLSDAARPRLLGELEMTGWLDFIVPLGDGRLAALGHEDITENGQRKISLAVSLIDVSGTGHPELLSRVTLDGLWGWVPSSRDDFAKVFRVLGDELPAGGLILFPFQAWSPTDYKYVGGVQLIDFDATTLRLRGLIRDAGWVERGIPYEETTVLTLSSELLQVVDIADRGSPRLRSKLELARNVQAFSLLPGDFTVQLAGDWYRGDTTLLVTPIDDPDASVPVSSIHIPSPYGRLFVNGSLAYIASVHDVLGEDGAFIRRETRVQVVDLTDPTEPVVRGSVALPEEVWPGYGYWCWGWGDEAIQVNGSTLVFHRYPYYWFFDGRGDAIAAPAAPPGGDPAQKVYVVDLADPDAPSLASTIEIPAADWAWGLKASGTTLYLSFYRAFVEDNQYMARYYLGRYDLADPASPVTHPEVNIPGMFVDAAPGGAYIYTLETWWDGVSGNSKAVFHALLIDGDKAILQSSVDLEGNGWVNGVQVKEGAAFAVSYSYETRQVGEVNQWYVRSTLLTIDLADPRAIRIAGEADVPFDYAYLQKVEGGRAFLGSYAGIFTFDVSDIASPSFEQFFRTQGWVQDIVLRGETAFVPSGYHGVQVLDLTPAP
jgi:hypothetical protein